MRVENLTATDKKRILFVDDEPNILAGLRNLLRRHRKKWTMAFVESGQEALDHMQKAPVDVIVTDMRMPAMDGAALLEEVKKRFPGTVRIVLSGHAEVQAAIRAVNNAHQFLSKPCDPALLEEVVDRSCRLQSLLNHERIRALVSSADGVPSQPQVFAKLSSALEDPDVEISLLSNIIKKDIALSLKLLKTVNSAFFGLPQKMTSIERAVAYLGTKLIKNVTLSVEVFGQFTKNLQFSDFRINQVHQHSFFVAGIAKNMFSSPDLAEDAFAAAVFHDLGKLILASRMGKEYNAICKKAAATNTPTEKIELETFGVSHAEIGGFLLGIWGIPYPIVDAVCNHHSPMRPVKGELDLTVGIYVANCLAHETCKKQQKRVCTSAANVPDCNVEPLDLAFLADIGVLDQLPRWTQIAEETYHKVFGDNNGK